VVALVALLAHASFQDLILLAANVRAEPGEPLPPLMVQFAKPQAKPSHGTGPVAAKTAQSTGDENGHGGSGEWIALQVEVNRQKARTGRIRVPSKEEVRKRLGDGHPGLWQADINWSRVCYGNQPELTDAWFATAAAFRQEAGFDPIFSQSLFWIVTRSLQCFY
jgi:hypothetical protein